MQLDLFIAIYKTTSFQVKKIFYRKNHHRFRKGWRRIESLLCPIHFRNTSFFFPYWTHISKRVILFLMTFYHNFSFYAPFILDAKCAYLSVFLRLGDRRCGILRVFVYSFLLQQKINEAYVTRKSDQFPGKSILISLDFPEIHIFP